MHAGAPIDHRLGGKLIRLVMFPKTFDVKAMPNADSPPAKFGSSEGMFRQREHLPGMVVVSAPTTGGLNGRD
jgi:hypothetical protein